MINMFIDLTICTNEAREFAFLYYGVKYLSSKL